MQPMIGPTQTTHSSPGRTFLTVGSGQLVSVIGTSLTGFGLAIWVYVETGSVTNRALVSLALAVPAIVISPFAGALVDRWDRRVVMLVADTAAGLGTLAIALLFMADALQLWHIYLVVAIGSVGNAFQSSALSSLIPPFGATAPAGRAHGVA